RRRSLRPRPRRARPGRAPSPAASASPCAAGCPCPSVAPLRSVRSLCDGGAACSAGSADLGRVCAFLTEDPLRLGEDPGGLLVAREIGQDIDVRRDAADGDVVLEDRGDALLEDVPALLEQVLQERLV